MAANLNFSEPLKLIYSSHPRWPLSPVLSKGDRATSRDNVIDISILDSSFNPPTLAHLALSRLPKPSAVTTHFDAKLLLYSMKNADKTPKLGDATPSERIEMMILFAKELEKHDHGGADGLNDLGSRNVAVAVCQQPIFVEKSKLLRTYFLSRMGDLSGSSMIVRLTFLMGIDTLERLFMPKYYGTDDAMQAALESLLGSDNGSHILCARRALGESYQQPDREWIDKAECFITSGAITVADIDEETSSLSSSEVRKNIQLGKSSLWKHQVLDVMAQYIEERALYREL